MVVGKVPLLVLISIVVYYICCLSPVDAKKEQRAVIGVSPEQLEYYQGKQFTCFNSGKSIPIEQVNDDYCDCPDGSDEPGTNACSNGKFYCINKGHKGEYIPSSHVNDGFCDCCDGSDEYQKKVQCKNTCEELGRESRKIKDEQIKKYTDGLKAKEEMVKEASKILAEKNQELSTLKASLEPLKKEIKDFEDLKEALNEQKEQREKLLEEQRKELGDNIEQEKATVETTPANNEDPEQDDGPTPQIATNQEQDEEEVKPLVDDELEAKKKGLEQQHQQQTSQTDQPQKDTHSSISDTITKSIFSTFYDMLPPSTQHFVDEFVTPTIELLKEKTNDLMISMKLKKRSFKDLDKWEISDVEEKLGNTRRELREAEEKVENIEKLLKIDMGKDNVFLPLSGKCFEVKSKEWTYSLCPYDRASQGGTSLGKWDSWGPNHSSMSFTNGLQCWGGPKRSLHVVVECGSENAASDVQEPAKCEYTMKFQTPAICDTEHLKILQLEDDHSF